MLLSRIPAVGATVGPVAVEETVTEDLALGVEEVVGNVVREGDGGEEDGELLMGVGVLDDTGVMLDKEELLLEALEDVEELDGIELLAEVELLLGEVLVDETDELLLNVTVPLDEDRLPDEVLEALLVLAELEIVNESVEVTNPKEVAEEDEELEEVIELEIAMTRAPQTPFLLAVPTPLFR
ncbi:hypothetical protein SLS59_004500 [Nothophoma quercina]|uniref:Uncharacterized protein n=1 Tax=Nothophoma quercina TaxID=749835 RepID=A0ABR3RGS7_9PLEO